MKLLIALIFLYYSGSLHAQPKTNIIYIMSDDHDADAISAYNNKFISTPNIDRLATEGILFSQCFVGNSICSPARATLLTGQHSHKNGVKDNFTRFDSSRITLPKLMKDNGYQTAMIGKWHLHSYPSGFDFWKILPGQGLYYDPRIINMQGDTHTYNGYASDVITDEALSWLRNREQENPFLLLLHHKAPHRNFVPPLKYLEIFNTKIFPEPPTLYQDTIGHGSAWRIQTMSILRDMRLGTDLKVDPKYLEDNAALKPDSNDVNSYNATMNRIPVRERNRMKEIYAERGRTLQQQRPIGKDLLKWKYQWYMQDYMACIASVDENIGRVLQYLDSSGLAQNTLVIYTSDQGFYLGENGWFDKRFMYDVSMQTPLLMRWPGRIRPNSNSSVLAQNIDFAPTILDAAGIKIPGWMQGISLKEVLTGKDTSLNRKSLYYHYYEYSRDHTVIPHLGIRNDQYKLIYFYTVNEWQFYDLKKDPSEQNNQAKNPIYQNIINQLKRELNNLRQHYDDHEPAGELK